MSKSAMAPGKEEDMPGGKERRKQERGKAELPPLTPEEWSLYEAQKEELRRRVHNERAQVQYEYETGLLCKKIKDDGYWARDPANRGKEICQVLCEITGCPASLSTFDRRIRLVRFYTLARVLELAGKGVSISAMVECTYGSPLLHEPLLTMACSGLSIRKLGDMRIAGNDELDRQLKDKKEQKQKPSQSEARSAALLAMLHALEGGKDKDEPGETKEKKAELDEETQAALKMREADLRMKEVELREREAEIHEVQRRLKEEEERLRRRELVAGLGPDPGAEIEARLRELQAAEAALLAAQAQTEKERALLAELIGVAGEAEAQLTATAGARAQEIAGMLAAAQEKLAVAAVVEARAQAVEEQEAQVAQREQEVQAREAQVGLREQASTASQAALLNQEKELSVREQALQQEMEEFEDKRQKLKLLWDEVNVRNFKLERQARYEGRIQFETPWTIDDALNQLCAHLYEAMDLGKQIKDFYLKDGHLPKIGGMSILIEAAEALHEGYKSGKSAVALIVTKYEEKYPERTRRAMEKWKEKNDISQIGLHNENGDDDDDDDDPHRGGGGGAGHGGGGGGSSSSFSSSASASSAAASGTARGASSGAAPPPAPPPAPKIRPHVVLGTQNLNSPQQGLLGVDEDGRQVSVCFNEIQAVTICGQQNFGKSVTIQLFIEMMLIMLAGICQTPKPLGVIVAHWDSGQGYPSSFRKMLGPNPDPNSLSWLRKKFGIKVKLGGVSRLKVYVPPNLTPRQMELRRKEYPGAEIIPIKMNMADLRSWGIRLVIGAVDNDSFYLMRLEQILAKMGDDPTLEMLEQKVREAGFAPRQLQLIMARLELLRDYVIDGPSIAASFKPGDLVILDLRQDFMDRDTALAFFTVLMEALTGAVDEDGVKFNKALIFDEAHKFMSKSSPIREQVGSAIKEMRHRGMWVLIATQDPSIMSDEVASLCTLTILHRLTDRKVLKWLQEHNTTLAPLTMEMLTRLLQGEVYICSSQASDPKFKGRPFKLRMRHPCTEPGGSTRTAVP